MLPVRLQLQGRAAVDAVRMTREQDDRITGIVGREQSRLWNFIRRRVPDARDAEDILQEVFAELVEANRLLMPIDHAAGWLFSVARNRITDLFRRRRPERVSDVGVPDDEERLLLEDLLPSPDAGPDTQYARHVLLEALELALADLPPDQREVGRKARSAVCGARGVVCGVASRASPDSVAPRSANTARLTVAR